MALKILRLVLLFLAPFLAYAIWLAVARRRARAHAGDPSWTDAPLLWLTAAGLVLVIASFVATALLSGEEAGGTYIPPRVIDGELVPAEVRPAAP